jgi:hypothetical protein
MKQLTLVAFLALVLTACGKKEAAPPPAPRSAPSGVSVGDGDPAAPATATGGAASADAPPPGANTVSANEPVQAPEVAKGAALIPISSSVAPEMQAKLLTDALNVFEDWNGGKGPRSLQQLVEKRIVDQIPIAPQGMKFVIDPARHAVILKAE